MTHLSFVVYGEFEFVDLPPWATLSTARLLALWQSHNTGRPPEEWDIRDERGSLMAPDRPVEDLDHVVLFLSLQVGIGGARLEAA